MLGSRCEGRALSIVREGGASMDHIRTAWLFSFFLIMPTVANADSLWDHNGSVMRLVANGEQREFRYEKPKESLLGAGVEQGTVLFDGYRVGDKYVGRARRFSKNCPAPLRYDVSGDVVTETKVVLKGRREVYDDNCRPTGRFKRDTLVFTYLGLERELGTIAQNEIAGSWVDSADKCSDPLSNGGLVVDRERLLDSHESGCKFEGGDTRDPTHWTMRGRCEGEGEYEEGGGPPLVQINLSVTSGVLTVVIHQGQQPYTPFTYSIKCGN